MADNSKIQFPTTSEAVTWFKDAATEKGVTQAQFFDLLRESYAASTLATDHPDYASSINTFESLASDMSDVLRGLVIAADAAAASARKEAADEVASLKQALADAQAASAALAERDAELDEAKAALAKAESEVDTLRHRAAKVDEAQDRIDAMQARLDDAMSAKAEADALRVKLEATEAMLAQANGVISGLMARPVVVSNDTDSDGKADIS